jgi:hypothetical protein
MAWATASWVQRCLPVLQVTRTSKSWIRADYVYRSSRLGWAKRKLGQISDIFHIAMASVLHCISSVSCGLHIAFGSTMSPLGRLSRDLQVKQPVFVLSVALEVGRGGIWCGFCSPPPPPSFVSEMRRRDFHALYLRSEERQSFSDSVRLG